MKSIYEVKSGERWESVRVCLLTAAAVALFSTLLTATLYPAVEVPMICHGNMIEEETHGMASDCGSMKSLGYVLKFVVVNVIIFVVWSFFFYMVPGFLWILALLLILLRRRVSPVPMMLILSFCYVLYSLLFLEGFVGVSPPHTNLLLRIPKLIIHMWEISLIRLYLVFVFSFVVSNFFVLRKAWPRLQGQTG